MISQVADTSIGPGPFSADDAQEKPGGNKEHSLGVLFVHGIGEQKRGDTLPWAGDPLYKWLSRWVCQDSDPADVECRPRLSNTRLTRPIPSEVDAPPYTSLHFPATSPGRAPTNQDWILAESWWATEFLPPTYSEALPLALVIAPWFIEQTGTRILDDILDRIRDFQVASMSSAASPEAGSSTGPSNPLARLLGDMLWRVARFLTKLVGLLVILTLGLLAQLVLIVLLLLGLIPPLRDLAVKLQLTLTGWLGDAYVMALSPIRFDAMVSQVRRDIRWLASSDSNKGRCKRIAVVAHSGGAPVAHEAVAGRDAVELNTDILLVTYGSGHSKVNSIRESMREKSGFYQTSPYGRALVALLVVTAFILGVQEVPPQPWTFIFLASAIGASIVFGILGGQAVKQLGPFRPRVPKGEQWIDYAALADIVPDGPIISQDGQNRTDTVSNLHAVLQDHGWYWHNDEEFVAEVARLLHAKATGRDLPVDPGQLARLEKAKFRREDRVLRYLNSGLLLIVSLPILLFDLGPALAEWIGEPIRSFLVTTLAGAIVPPKVLSFHTPSIFWANVLGVIVIAIALSLWNKLVLAAFWKNWTRKEENVMFEPGDPRAVQKWRGNAKGFIIASTIVPVGVLVAALVETFVFNVGFPQGVQGIQTFLATVVNLTPIEASVVQGIATSTTLNIILRLLLFAYAGAIALTSLTNAFKTWVFHTSATTGEGQDSTTSGRPIFRSLLAHLSADTPKP